MSPKVESLRIVQFDDETRELMQELRSYLHEGRSIQREVENLLGKLIEIEAFDISEEIISDGETATFTFADLQT